MKYILWNIVYIEMVLVVIREALRTVLPVCISRTGFLVSMRAVAPFMGYMLGAWCTSLFVDLEGMKPYFNCE